jgi:hypothetical protein
MSDEPMIMEVLYIDSRRNLPHNDQIREIFRQELRKKFEMDLPEAVERIWEIPDLALKAPFGPYVELLVESRELFIEGHFYSCVAMCGIVGERIIKDLRASVLNKKGDQVQSPDSAAFNQSERIDISRIARFLKKAGILSDEAAEAANNLRQLRNSYAHARGEKPEVDAIKAIKWLHTLIEGTVSVFKDFEIKDGALVRKTNTY